MNQATIPIAGENAAKLSTTNPLDSWHHEDRDKVLWRCGLSSEHDDPLKKPSTLAAALEANSLIFAIPILLGFVAQAFLPLKQI